MSRIFYVYALWKAEREKDLETARRIRDYLKDWPIENESKRRGAYSPAYVEKIAGTIQRRYRENEKG